MRNSPNCEGSYYFQSYSKQVITGQDDSNKTWKDYWFWAGGAWEAPPQVLREFGRSVPTTWNLNKQYVEVFAVSDEALQWVLSIPEMSDGRRHCQALTQSKVLHFMGWWHFRMREDFYQYRAEHPELDPFPPYSFGTFEHAVEAEPLDQGGVS